MHYTSEHAVYKKYILRQVNVVGKCPSLHKLAHVTCNSQGRSDGGGYIGVYTPKINKRFVHVWDISTCFEIAMTS